MSESDVFKGAEVPTDAVGALAGEADNGASAAKAPRQQSKVQFPYHDLKDAISITTTVWGRYGGECQVAQLAGALGSKPTSGAFRTKVLSAKMFGLIQGTAVLTTTPLGMKIVSEATSRQARAEAFLKVELFRGIYDEVTPTGGMLPTNTTGLDALIRRLGVVEGQIETARQVFQRSARQAGYLEHGEDRLVAPALGSEPPQFKGGQGNGADDDGGGTPDGSGGQNERVENHPLMVGLLQSLPKTGVAFPAKARQRWLNAVKVNFDFIYGPAEDEETSGEGATPAEESVASQAQT